MVSEEYGSDESENEISQRHSNLPQGSEKDLIKFYFSKGFTYKHITLMLEKHHNIDMNERTLRRRLKDYGCSRRGEVDNKLETRVRNIIVDEIGNGPNSLNSYRTMWHILRIRHHINIPHRLVARILREVDPQGKEQRKCRCLKHRTYVSPDPIFAGTLMATTS